MPNGSVIAAVKGEDTKIYFRYLRARKCGNHGAVSGNPKKTTVRLKSTYILFGLLISFMFGQCQTKSSADKQVSLSNNKALRIDSTITLLKSNGTISIDNIRELNIVDTVYSYGSKGDVYCDTTVQLTNAIFYSIISLPDTFGVCSYYFVLTMDEQKKSAIASKLIEPACDIDFSADSYRLYDYFVISKDSILLRETTIYQKKNRTSTDEEENIDHKEIKDQYLFIKQTGEIVLNTK